MKLEQFSFKPSLEFGVNKIAELTTGKDSKVIIKESVNTIQLIKVLNNVNVYIVSFQNNEQGKIKLEKSLKNISKRK